MNNNCNYVQALQGGDVSEDKPWKVNLVNQTDLESSSKISHFLGILT